MLARLVPTAASLSMRSFDQFLWIALVVLVAVVDLRSQSGTKELGTATEIRVAEPGWWPTKGISKRAEYVGSRLATNATRHNRRVRKILRWHTP